MRGAFCGIHPRAPDRRALLAAEVCLSSALRRGLPPQRKRDASGFLDDHQTLHGRTHRRHGGQILQRFARRVVVKSWRGYNPRTERRAEDTGIPQPRPQTTCLPQSQRPKDGDARRHAPQEPQRQPPGRPQKEPPYRRRETPQRHHHVQLVVRRGPGLKQDTPRHGL